MKDKEAYFKIMKNYKRILSNVASEIVAYDNWSDKFCREKVNDLYYKLISEFNDIDFTQFTPDELKEFDFQWFDDDLICMPVWAIDCLTDGCTLSSISGDEFIFKKPTEKNSFKDSRFGVTAFGFKKSQLRDSKLNSLLNIK